MPGRINTTQGTGVTAWRGTVTKENHIYGLFRSNPQKASEVMTTLMSAMHLPTLDSYLSKEVPVKEYEDDSELFWDVTVSSRRNIPLVEARRADGSKVTRYSSGTTPAPNVGVGFEPFYLVFPTDWFALGEVIWGNLNEVYPVIIKQEGRQEGTNTVYLVEPFGINGSQGIPAERLLAGEKFSVGYAPVESNLSRKVGDVRFTAPISMHSNWQTVRIQHKVGGKELGRRLAARIPVIGTVNGKQVTKYVDRWMYNVTWQIEQQWSEYKNNSLERGVSTIMENGEVTNFGLSGLPNKQGSGFRQLMEMGTQIGYTKFSLDMIEEAFSGKFAGKVDYAQRKVVVSTGEWGAKLINKEAKKEASGWMPLYSASAPSYFQKGNNTEFTPAGNGIAIMDYQVTRWISANGLDITIMIDSSKDDIQTNKIMHPNGGTAESYRMDCFYAGNEDEPNVQKCMIKNRPERRGYQWGPFDNPFTGEFNNGAASYDEDSATVHYLATQGIRMVDPGRVVSFIPAMLLG